MPGARAPHRSSWSPYTAKANLLNASTSTFLELLGNGRVYMVPPYQRDYSWTEEQWEDLWLDILDVANRPDDSHYMGALVVEGRSDREFAVIDGQQRIATLSILVLAVMIARLHHLAAAGHQQDNHQRAEALRARFIGEKDPASLVEASKLTLRSTRVRSAGRARTTCRGVRRPLRPTPPVLGRARGERTARSRA